MLKRYFGADGKGERIQRKMYADFFLLKDAVKIREASLSQPLDLQDILDKEREKGLLIGEKDALLPVNPYQVGIPITETFRDGRGINKGRGSEFLEEFLGTVEKGHYIIIWVRSFAGLRTSYIATRQNKHMNKTNHQNLSNGRK